MTTTHFTPGTGASEPTPPPLRGHRGFRRLLLAQGGTYTAEALLVVLLTFVALESGATGAAVVLIAQGLPRAALLPLGGVLTDRFGPSRVASVAAAARAATLVALAAWVLAVGVPPVAALALVGALLGVLVGAAYPAGFALVPTVVDGPRLPAANAALGGVESVGDLLGPVAAAGLYAATGAGPALAVVAVLTTASAVAFAALHRHVPEHAEPEERPRFLEGLRLAWADADLRRLLLALAALSVLVTGPVMVGGAVLAEQRFGGREGLGILIGGFGVGSLLGLALVPRLGRLDAATAPAVGGLALGAGLVGVAAAPSIWLAAGVAVAMGAVASVLGVELVSWLQQRAPEAVRGRIMALVAFAMLALDPISYVVAGALLPLGPTATLAVPGGLLALLGLVGWWGARRRARAAAG